MNLVGFGEDRVRDGSRPGADRCRRVDPAVASQRRSRLRLLFGTLAARPIKLLLVSRYTVAVASRGTG